MHEFQGRYCTSATVHSCGEIIKVLNEISEYTEVDRQICDNVREH